MKSQITNKSGACPIYFNVKGVPFRIGERVIVVAATDETCNMDYFGKIGVVVYFEYSCGCGQTYPKDPMIGVQFDDEKTEEFWREEIKKKKRSPTKLANARQGPLSNHDFDGTALRLSHPTSYHLLFAPFRSIKIWRRVICSPIYGVFT
jgi:hypothetical protein